MPWIQALAQVLQLTDRKTSARQRTSVSCELQADKRCLFIPPLMGSLQAESLRYLQVFARRNGYELVEDQRTVDVQPILERRSTMPSPMASGLARLLHQTGLPGPYPGLSWPQRLRDPDRHLALTDLIAMSAFSLPQAKRCVLLPNTALVGALDDDAHPIDGMACEIVTGATRYRIHYFEAPAFRCIGHSTDSQVVCHVLHAGGPLKASRLWTHPACLTRSAFRFQLFKSIHPGHDFGLFHSTLYFDKAQHKQTEREPTRVQLA